MIWNLILINFLICQWSYSDTSDQHMYFDVILHNNKVIGSLKATRTTKDSITYYHSSTIIKTRLIKDIRVNYKYDVTFNNTLLEKADVHITVNEKPHAETYTQRTSTYYQIVKNDDKKKTLKDSISYATIQLYFKEPVNVDNCYSEQDGSFNTIAALGNHSYQKINSKGKVNTYYYKNGALKKATIDGGLIKFEIIAKE